MHRTILLTSAMLLLASPAAARDLDPSAGDNGVTGGGAGGYSDEPSDEHPNAEGQNFSYPSCATSCAGASGRDASEGGVQGDAGTSDGGSSSGSHGADGSPDNEHGGPNF